MALKLRLKADNGEPLYRQIEKALRAAIESGHLKPGARLPSAVELAREHRINKLTVVKAFQAMEKAGLLRSEVGRGTFVGGDRRSAGDGAPAALEPRPEVARSVRRLREGYARSLRELMAVEWPPGTINLRGGVPSPDAVPEELLGKLAERALRHNPRRLFAYSEPGGLLELRQELARMLAQRGIAATPDEIIITNGSQQAISLAAAWARDDSRAALCETPSFPNGVAGCFMLFGHALQTVTWENGAPSLSQLRALAAGRRTLFYLCPDFQNPTGLSMSTEARHALAGFARANDVVVLEDEIFREMRFEGAQPQSLYSLMPAGRRIMVGSLSKDFMPGLRVGFLVADRPLIGEFLSYKRHMDMGGPPLVQAIAACFLRDGYDKYMERMRAYYRLRRDAALEALETAMPPGVAWTRPQGGFQLWVTMPPNCSSIQLFLRAIEQGVAIVPGPAHDVDGRYLNSFRIGYAHPDVEAIRIGIKRLGDLVKALADHAPGDGAAAGGLGVLI